jgi:3-oxoacyl-[acyl-carrier protein] reductase
MRDRYRDLVNSGPGKRVAAALGLPRPVKLRRYAAGQPLLVGPALLVGVGQAPLLPEIERILRSADVAMLTHGAIRDAQAVIEQPVTDQAVTDQAVTDEGVTRDGVRLGAVVIDVSAAHAVQDLESLRAMLAPSLRQLDACARVVLVGTPPDNLAESAPAATQRALGGFIRSVGKELRQGATANLLYAGSGLKPGSPPGSGRALESTLRFLLSARSAYVDGQVVRVEMAGMRGRRTPVEVSLPADWSRPLAGRVALVTGASRGIGASIAEVLARDGAQVICLDVPAAGEALAAVANKVGGTAFQLDITAPDAGERVAAHVVQRHGGTLDVLIHNAGVTRDKLLVNTDAQRWGTVLGVNLEAQLRINDVLLDPARGSNAGGLADGGRIVTVSSTSGIAGNRGQASYAASKAGLIGMVESLAHAEYVAARGITVNAVAPGFIETEMTARMPLATREIGRRVNSLGQGGQPVDVAETIAWLAQSASAGMSGQVVRVCGQSVLGA